MRKAPSTDSPDSTPLALASNTPPSPTRWKPPATPTNSFSSPQSQSQPQPAPPVQITLGGLPQGLVAPTPPIPKPEGKKYPKEFLVALYDPKRAKPEGMEGMESVVQEMMEDRVSIG